MLLSSATLCPQQSETLTDSNKCAKVSREFSGHCKSSYCFSLQLVLLLFSVADKTPLLGSQQVTLLPPHPGPLPAGVQVGGLPGGQTWVSWKWFIEHFIVAFPCQLGLY